MNHPTHTVVRLFALLAGVSFVGAEQAREPASAWYDTRPIDLTLVEQKRPMEVTSEAALRMFHPSGGGVRPNWKQHLPEPIQDADQVRALPTEHVRFPRPERANQLQRTILGFDAHRVRVVITRYAGSFLWHHYYRVDADLMIQRSAEIEGALNMATYTQPFTRTIKGIGYGSTTAQVEAALGPPEAIRITQAEALWWAYYFEEDITIEYQHTVHQVRSGVPEEIRQKSSGNPMVRYRDEAEAAD